MEQSDYSFNSVGAALTRFFQLELEVGGVRALPLEPSEGGQGNPASDRPQVVEWVDLKGMLVDLTHLEALAIFLEYTRPTESVEGALLGNSKTEEIYRRCGVRMNGARYTAVIRNATDKVRATLNQLGWLVGVVTTQKAQSP